MSDSKLKALREDIDALDSQLLELFQKRAEKAAEIYKAKGEGSPWRPAREAAHLRELCDQVREAGGALTEQRVRRIWRAIYADSVASQSQLTIRAAKEHEVAVRTYFGNAILFLEKQNAREALAETTSATPSAVAAIALGDWRILPDFKGLFIHEAVCNEAGSIIGWLIAKRPPEPSGLDCTLFAIWAENQKEANSLATEVYKKVRDVGRDVSTILLREYKGAGDNSPYLLLLNDWCASEDVKVKTNIHYLGVVPGHRKALGIDESENE